jgi:hypothetical protein
LNIAEFRRGLLAAGLALACLAGIFVSRGNAQESAGQYWARERGQDVAAFAAGKWDKRTRRHHIADVTTMINSRSGVHGIVTAAAQRNGVPAALLHGVIRVESNYRCNAYNRAGKAIGIGQVKAATGRSVGIHGSLYDCQNGAEAAARYLRIAIARGGAGCAGVSLYERGVYARPVCTGYGRRVMALARI